jgi:hypothetical protein
MPPPDNEKLYERLSSRNLTRSDLLLIAMTVLEAYAEDSLSFTKAAAIVSPLVEREPCRGLIDIALKARNFANLGKIRGYFISLVLVDNFHPNLFEISS